MLSILTAVLPTLLELVGIALKAKGASDELLKSFGRLIEQSANEGLISKKTKDVYASQKDALDAKLKG